MEASDVDGDLATGPLPRSLSRFLGFLLRRAHVLSLECVRSTLPPDRHPSEMAVLTAVEAFGPASQRLLGERLAVNRTIMVQLVDRLEGDGLVVRNRDPRDRRSYAVELTDRGRRTLVQFERQAAAHRDCLTRRLTARQGQRLDELLRALLSTPDGGLEGMPSKLGERTGFLLARAHFLLRNLGKEPLVPLGVEPPHLAVLVLLDDLGPSPQQRLARELGVSGTIVVQFVDHLEEEGLVERRRSPDDRRVYLVTLTADGARVAQDGPRIVAEATAELTRPLGPGGAEELRQLLLRLLGGEAGEG